MQRACSRLAQVARLLQAQQPHRGITQRLSTADRGVVALCGGVVPYVLRRGFASAPVAELNAPEAASADTKHIRDFAIIAHVDHGKTTMMDKLMRECGGEASLAGGGDSSTERAMDSLSLERERGITIQAKYTSMLWRGNTLNAVDTPGHAGAAAARSPRPRARTTRAPAFACSPQPAAKLRPHRADFGGEVERVLGMVDGAVLLVDAAEGPLAQTKFVVSKAVSRGLRPILVLNKVDRDAVSEQRCNEIITEVFDLFAALGATDEQVGRRNVQLQWHAADARSHPAARLPDAVRFGTHGLGGEQLGGGARSGAWRAAPGHGAAAGRHLAACSGPERQH